MQTHKEAVHDNVTCSLGMPKGGGGGVKKTLLSEAEPETNSSYLEQGRSVGLDILWWRFSYAH